MATGKDICNLGLAKLGPQSVENIEQPRSPLERACARGYRHWKRSELGKRRWVFATHIARLTLEEQMTDTALAGYNTYKYALPNDYLRAVRQKTDAWQIRGKYLFASTPEMILEYVRECSDDELNPEFIEVLACRAALELCKTATDSSNSQQVVRSWYKDAVNEAGRQNAWMLWPDNTETADDNDSWLVARWN